VLLWLLVLFIVGCGHEAGPLAVTGGDSSWLSAPVPVGRFLTAGIFVPANTSGEDAIFESFEPADPGAARGLELRYAAVRLPDPPCQIGGFLGWPPGACPVAHMHPVEGFRHRAGERAVEILVGARSSRPGIWSIGAFRLRYRVGVHRYSEVYSQGIVVRSNPTFAFQTPQRDVVCQGDGRERLLQCQLSAGEIEPHPATCLQYRLVGYSLRPFGRAEVMCGRKDMIQPRTILRTAIRRVGFECVMRGAGVRCHNRSGHGFFVSRRRSYRF
jgi:uncharacterized protein DUF6636